MEKVSYVGVMRRAGVERKILDMVKIRQAVYLGHVLRGEKYGILKLIITGKMEAKRGWSKETFVDEKYSPEDQDQRCKNDILIV